MHLSQIFLRPGSYRTGEGMKTFTSEDLSRLASNTRKLLAAGIKVPLWPAHTSPGDPAGGPQQFGNAPATDNKGWLVDVKQLADGSLQQTLDVLDDETEKAIKNGKIKFTSPEIGEYTDGLGRFFDTVIRHMALTATPRNPNQGPFVPAVQFSLGNRPRGVLQLSLADLQPERRPMPNPDMPTANSCPTPEQVKSVLAKLSKLGIVLPASWQPNVSGFLALDSSLATKIAADAAADQQTSQQIDQQQDIHLDATERQLATADNVQFSEDTRAHVRKAMEAIRRDKSKNRKGNPSGDPIMDAQFRAMGFL